MPSPTSNTDGVVTIRPPIDGDRARLIAGRDAAFHRFLGEGSEDPVPTCCIVVGGEVVGWVDADGDPDWLRPGELNLGYNVFAAHRGAGHGTRAVKLLLHRLALTEAATTATLLIDPLNTSSLALAERAGFRRHGHLHGEVSWKRPVPPLVHADGVVAIRRREPADLDADLEAKDDDQRRWLWLPWQREAWERMSTVERRDHAARVLRDDHATFGAGPKWTFTVDTAAGTRGVAYVDCDLASDHVRPGEANISYACHPAHRGNGYVRRAVRLVVEFLRQHTGARLADLIADEANGASRRVAHALGAPPIERWVDDDGRTMIRHRLHLDPPALARAPRLHVRADDLGGADRPTNGTADRADDDGRA